MGLEKFATISRKCLSLSLVVALGCLFWSAPFQVWAIQAETRTEKETHLKRQATGNLFRQWNFDQAAGEDSLAEFARLDLGDGPEATWKVKAETTAPSSPNAVEAVSTCSTPTCYRLLVPQGLNYEYPDISVRVRPDEGSTKGVSGIALGVKDERNFYAAVVDLTQKSLEILRVVDGQETLLGRTTIKPKPVAWHTLRVQRNTIISKDFIETFFDGQLALSVEDQTLGLGEVGLVLKGEAKLQFDNFYAVPLFSHRPFSPPAAY
jgi:hypothetical protein